MGPAAWPALSLPRSVAEDGHFAIRIWMARADRQEREQLESMEQVDERVATLD